MRTRSATLPDVEPIYAIIRPYADTGVLLPRSIAELSENIRDFVVAEAGGEVIGCGALHLYGMHLAEIRSIAVRPSAKGLGAGRKLVEALLDEAARHRVTSICLFTRIPTFFEHMGFGVARREELPDKIYKDCINCPNLFACDEVAMIRGPIPQEISPRDAHVLVPLVRLGA